MFAFEMGRKLNDASESEDFAVENQRDLDAQHRIIDRARDVERIERYAKYSTVVVRLQSSALWKLF